MATHSSILAWRITWTVEPGGLQSMGSQSRTGLKRLSMGKKASPIEASFHQATLRQGQWHVAHCQIFQRTAIWSARHVYSLFPLLSCILCPLRCVLRLQSSPTLGTPWVVVAATWRISCIAGGSLTTDPRREASLPSYLVIKSLEVNGPSVEQ